MKLYIYMLCCVVLILKCCQGISLCWFLGCCLSMTSVMYLLACIVFLVVFGSCEGWGVGVCADMSCFRNPRLDKTCIKSKLDSIAMVEGMQGHVIKEWNLLFVKSSMAVSIATLALLFLRIQLIAMMGDRLNPCMQCMRTDLPSSLHKSMKSLQVLKCFDKVKLGSSFASIPKYRNKGTAACIDVDDRRIGWTCLE